MEGVKFWICGECDCNNNYDTDPLICNLCSEPNPNPHSNAKKDPNSDQSVQPGSNPLTGTSVAQSTQAKAP